LYSEKFLSLLITRSAAVLPLLFENGDYCFEVREELNEESLQPKLKGRFTENILQLSEDSSKF